MKTVQRGRPGTFLRIRLGDGSFGYGRTLHAPYTTFYDYRTTDPVSDVAVIASKPVLFRQAVRGEGRWEVIGRKELAGEVAKPVIRFMQDLADYRKCAIFDSTGMEREVGPEECVGVERAAVWEAHHIEERLLDSFMGRENASEASGRVRLRD